MRMLRIWAATAVCGLALATSAQGTLVVSEQFDYPTGTIAAKNGGTGFSGTWAGSQSVTTPGLTYTGLTTVGNASSDTNSETQSAVRPFDATGLYVGDASNINSGGPLWVSFLFNTSSAVTSSATVMLRAGLFGDTAGASTVGSGVKIATDGKLYAQIRDTQGTVGGAVNYSVGTTNLVVMKYSFTTTNNGDTVQLWLNPSLPGTTEGALGAAASTASANMRATGSGTNGGSFFMRGDGGYIGAIDEIRVGTTLADVIPIPEPTSLSLLGLAGLMALRRRRA